MVALRELFLALICSQIALQIDIELLTNVLDTFEMRNSIIVDESHYSKTEFLKELFLQGFSNLGDIVPGDFVLLSFNIRGFCPRVYYHRGFCPKMLLSQGVMS